MSGAIRLCYKLKLKRVWHAPVPVIVAGNLIASGSGKTPVVVWSVEQLQQRGIRVEVISRGYGGKAESYPLLLLADTATVQAGDESVSIYQRTGAPAAVSPMRSDTIKTILAQHPGAQIIVTDDDLQHYRLTRDVKIVAIDGVRRFGNGWWLPAGPMRERARRLESVDTVIINGGVPRNSEVPIHLLPGQAVNLHTGMRCDAAQLEHVVTVAGIGHSPRFFTTLKMCGVQSKKCVSLADRQSLNHTDVSVLVSTGQALVMTEKDAVKCRAFTEENWQYSPADAQLSGDGPTRLLTQLASLASGHQLRCSGVRLMES